MNLLFHKIVMWITRLFHETDEMSNLLFHQIDEIILRNKILRTWSMKLAL